MSVYCPQCGAPANDGAFKCEYCGYTLRQSVQQPAYQQPVYQQPTYQQPTYQQPTYQQPTYQQPVNQVPDIQAQVGYINSSAVSEKSSWPVKSKLVAVLLALFLGGLGIHHFYLGKPGKGVLYLLFCWTSIPSILACIDIIVLLVSSNESLESKYKCHFS